MSEDGKKSGNKSGGTITLTLAKQRVNGISHDETISGLKTVQEAENIARQHGLYDDTYIIRGTKGIITRGKVGRVMDKGKRKGQRYLKNAGQVVAEGNLKKALKDPVKKEIYNQSGTSLSYREFLKTYGLD